MTEKLSLNEVYDTIQNTKNRLSVKGSVTHVFKRRDYEAVLIVLSDEKDLLADKDIHVKVNFQHGILTVSFRRHGF
ncbi:MAG: hypothetical protein IJP99_08540 [Methanobrevibacter sp.]|nr:hypothetical protein [Methanobrevibacter sp.]